MRNRIKYETVVELLGNGILAGFLFAGIHYLYLYQPVAFVFFAAEDRWSEYGTFVSWFLSSSMLVWALLKFPEFRRPGHYIFALVAFLIAMEEISWGQRILGIATPGFISVLSTQAELNFHNILHSASYLPYIAPAILIGGIVLPIFAFFSATLRQLCERLGIPIVPVQYWPFIVLPVYFFEYHWRFVAFALSYELAELFLSITVSVITLHLVLNARENNSVRGTRAVLATSIMMTIVWFSTAPLAHYFDDPGILRYYLHRVSRNELPRNRMYKQADLIFDYIDQHPQYLQGDAHYIHGLVLLKLGQEEKAAQVLDIALTELEQRQQKEPDNPEVYRDSGKVLQALGRRTDAIGFYQKAVELDTERLNEITEPATEANYRWSLAKTLFAMGRMEEASEQIQMAIDVTPLASQRSKIDWWFRNEQRTMARLLPDEIRKTDVN